MLYLQKIILCLQHNDSKFVFLNTVQEFFEKDCDYINDTSAVNAKQISSRLNEVYGKICPLKLQNSKQTITWKHLHKNCLHNSWQGLVLCPLVPI